MRAEGERCEKKGRVGLEDGQRLRMRSEERKEKKKRLDER